MSARFALRAREALVDGELRAACVVVEGERIADVLAYGDELGGLDVVDVEGVLLPALVDTHVHVNEPGRTEWEGFETATAAAASGGVGTLVDMPLNCIPVTTTLAALETKLEAVSAVRLAMDVGFWGGVVPGNHGDLAAMAERGMLGAKCFLCHSGIDDFPASRAEDLRRAMPVLRDAGVPLLAHAELEEGAPPCAGDVRAYSTYLASRPASMEDRAIELLVTLARETRCAVHVVHLSSASALPILAAAKDEGLPITVETCPHYLCLAAESIPDGETTFKCAPPIREEANREALWEAVASGLVDLVTSDHSPCTPHLKKPREGDFCGAWGGIASLSLGLPSVWSEASRRGLSLARVVSWMSDRPARLAGLASRKGRIARGLDADLCVFEPDASRVVEREELRFRHKVSPYVGREVRGRVSTTWVRGRRVFAGGAVEAGEGRTILSRDRGVG